MFVGMVRMESQARSTSNMDSKSIQLPLDMGTIQADGPVVVPGVISAGGSHKKLGRRPGYMRAEREGERLHLTSAKCSESVCHSGPPEPDLTCTVTDLQGSQQQTLQCRERSNHCQRTPSTPHKQTSTPSHLDLPRLQSSVGCDQPSRACGADSSGSTVRDQFTSSFSFIQLSLSTDNTADSIINQPSPCALSQAATCPHPQSGTGPALSDKSVTVVTSKSLDPAGVQWGSREGDSDPMVTSELKDLLPDSDSCSLSLDSSDSASASSLTSGYESITPCGDGWDTLLKRYEGILQDCLHSNRTNAQIEGMMLKLQRLQQKAVLEDDYDTAERFGQKLEELQREKSSLKMGLPSRHPAVSRFLERLRAGVHTALHEATGNNCREQQEVVQVTPLGGEHSKGPRKRRDRLLQEKGLIQEEMQKLHSRLQVLQERNQQLEQELLQEEELEKLEQLEDVEGPVLRSYTSAQLQELSRVLDDLVTSEHRAQICAHPPPLILRLKKQEEALSTCIKETTAKVVMSQRLGGSLRRKISASETQLLALHEAKLAAISGSDFSSAKELKAEMKALYSERDRLEGLVKRLQALSSGNSQELARMKEEHRQLRHDLEHKQTQFEKTQRENTVKYVELLEDRLHSCGNSVVERVWEADLEACHLLLRGLQLRAPTCCGPDNEEATTTPEPCPQPHPKQEQDCAMLTALGGRWCPEADLQNSEFTKKLEEFLFCMEDNHPEDPCVEDLEAMEVTEQCEMISHRLESLEEQLQTAILDRNHALAQSLQKEVQEMKAALQAMLKQLEEAQEPPQDQEEEENEEECGDEEDEDQYFSDSWTI